MGYLECGMENQWVVLIPHTPRVKKREGDVALFAWLRCNVSFFICISCSSPLKHTHDIHKYADICIYRGDSKAWGLSLG